MGQPDKYGVISRYATGKILYDPDHNFRSDGKRFDFDVGADEFVSCEIRGYFKATQDYNDDVAGKMGGGNHTDGSRPKCYVLDIGTDGGNIRLRYEEDHPSTPTLIDGAGDGSGNGKGIVGAYVGFSFVKRNLSNGNVLLEIWQDKGNNEGDEPANQWERVASWVDDELRWTDPPNDHAETIRVDNDDGDLQWKWVSLQEITDSDSQDPDDNTGGGDGTGGSGSGSGGTGDGTGGTGSGPSTPAPPPPPPPEVYQEVNFEMMWNINYKSGDPCNVNAPPEFTTPVEVFTSQGDEAYVDIPKDMRASGWFVNKDSVLIGRKLRAIKVFMKKVGTPLVGDIKINVYSGNNDLVDTFDTILAVNALDGNTTEYTFTRESPVRVLQQNDRISIDWIGGDGDTVNYIRVQITEQDKVDSTATCLFVTDDNQHIEVTEPLDLSGSVYI